MVHKVTAMSSEYEPPEVEEIGAVKDLTGGSPPGEGDNTSLDVNEPGVSAS